MKWMVPCEILDKYGSNAYKIDLPTDLSLSPIFNVSEMVAFRGQIPKEGDRVSNVHKSLSDVSFPPPSIPQAEKVLDSRVYKKTRHQVYMEHRINWKDKPLSEATWVHDSDFSNFGIPSSFIPQGVT